MENMEHTLGGELIPKSIEPILLPFRTLIYLEKAHDVRHRAAASNG